MPLKTEISQVFVLDFCCIYFSAILRTGAEKGSILPVQCARVRVLKVIGERLNSDMLGRLTELRDQGEW